MEPYSLEPVFVAGKHYLTGIFILPFYKVLPRFRLLSGFWKAPVSSTCSQIFPILSVVWNLQNISSADLFHNRIANSAWLHSVLKTSNSNWFVKDLWWCESETTKIHKNKLNTAWLTLFIYIHVDTNMIQHVSMCMRNNFYVQHV